MTILDEAFGVACFIAALNFLQVSIAAFCFCIALSLSFLALAISGAGRGVASEETGETSNL